MALLRELIDSSTQLKRLEAHPWALASVPWSIWIGLVAIAVGGSCLYGASLAYAMREGQLSRGALWLALSAGCAWAIFIPTLSLVTGRRLLSCAHAGLITMAYGELVLVSAALINLLLGSRLLPLNAAFFNICAILCSNIVMAIALTKQMSLLGIAPPRVIICWICVLNGSGALFFWCYYRLLQL